MVIGAALYKRSCASGYREVGALNHDSTRLRFSGDSPLEEAVMSELVSAEISLLAGN
jgi:hypothetical protein